MPKTAIGATEREPDVAELVQQAASGDRRARAGVYRAHAPAIARVVLRLVGDDGEVDDLVQETMTEGLAGLARLRDPGAVRSFLTTIAVRKSRRRLAQRYRRRALQREVAHVAPRISDPADRERVELLYRALDTLHPDLRTPWVLHRIEGETLPRVAQLCDSSLSTIKRRIAKAQARLNRRLDAR